MNNTIQKNSVYKKYVLDSKLQYFKPHSTKVTKTFVEELTSSLKTNPKFIDPKYFYDQKGSELFEQICSLPEYYPTRTEIDILKNSKKDLFSFLDDSFRLVELGSGSSNKTRLILDILDKVQKRIEYFPIDISEILTESSEILLREYCNLHITGIIDTYEGGLEFIENYDDKKNLIIFLGSSYGNFLPKEGEDFLKKINSIMKKEDLFLMGLDLVKEKIVLERAYNDTQGITAKFNLNVLSRINDELDADFNLKNFEHVAKYNTKNQRIEMYLKSTVNQSVIISKANLSINLRKDEMIHTEHSHKYHINQIQELIEKTGFIQKKIWTDKNKYFALILISKK